MLHSNFVILGIIIGSIGAISYLIFTLQGKVKPNKVSFLLWSIAPLVAFVAEIQQGVGIQSLMTFSVGFLPLLIFIASFFNRKAEWKITRFDLMCGIFSVVGLFLWAITHIGNVAILFMILSDGLAAIPTVIKSYKYPKTESGWTYFTACISAGLTLLTITNWKFESYGFPIYILLINLIISSLVQFKIGEKFKLK